MPRAPRQPKGPPLDSGWLKDAAAARRYLTEQRTPKRAPEEVAELVGAGRQGVSLAEIVTLFFPYRDWIRANRGALSPPDPKLSDEVILEDRWSEITHTDMLATGANPNGRRLGDIHDELKKQDPLAPLGAIADEALGFVVTSVVMTERYAHLRPDLFSAKDMAVLDLDLAAGDAVSMQLGQGLGRTPPSAGSK